MGTGLTLYELTDEHRQICVAIEEAGGEITPEIEMMLSINADNFVTKAEGYCEIVAKYRQMAQMAKERIETLQQIKKVAENAEKRLKERMQQAMEEYDMQKVEIGLHRLSFRTSKAVEVIDEAKIPNQYIKVTTTIDKTALRTDLMNGIEVEGARLQTNKSLQIR